MSNNNQYGEKTEQPTPHRLREAKRKGQVLKSSEVVSAVGLLALTLAFISFGDILLGWLKEMMSHFLGENLNQNVSMEQLQTLILDAGIEFFKIMALIFGTALTAGLLGNYMQIGFVYSSEKMMFSLDKLNPAEGFKRIFSRRALFELFKAILKVCLVGVIAYVFFASRVESFFDYMFLFPKEFFSVFSSEILDLCLRVSMTFMVLAILDYLYQRQEYFKSLRMTKQEVKEEFKQMEGDPAIRGKLREKQRRIASQRMMQDVPSATVVITNPTALAVALKYSAEKLPVPVVVAKGAGLIAARIRETAKEHQVPVIENKPVARMLFEQVEIGQVIPIDMYKSVAEILALVYEINKEQGIRS